MIRHLAKFFWGLWWQISDAPFSFISCAAQPCSKYLLPWSWTHWFFPHLLALEGDGCIIFEDDCMWVTKSVYTKSSSRVPPPFSAKPGKPKQSCYRVVGRTAWDNTSTGIRKYLGIPRGLNKWRLSLLFSLSSLLFWDKAIDIRILTPKPFGAYIY